MFIIDKMFKNKIKAMLLLSFLIMCDTYSPPKSSDVKEALPFKPISRRVPTQSQEIKVFIDASVSCLGFVTKENSEYISFLRTLRKMAEGLPVSFYKFGEYTAQTSISEAFEEYFYTHRETRLAQLFNNFASLDTRSLPGTFLVITDGCQSYKKQDIISLITPILSLVERGYSFQILGIKSHFNGRVFSEIRGGASLGRYTGRRPFYCFIISTNEDFGKTLQNRLSAANISSNLINFSIFPEVSFRFADSVPSLRYWEVKDSVVYLRWQGSPPGYLKLIMNLESDFIPNINPGLKCNITSLNWESKENIPPICRLFQIRGSEKSIYSLFSFDNKSKECQVAKIELYSQGNTFSPPDWVKEWSTDTDVDKRYFDRTLYLKDFIEEIANRIFEKFPLFVFYVVVR